MSWHCSVDHTVNKVTHLTVILSAVSAIAPGNICVEVVVFAKVVYGDIVLTSGTEVATRERLDNSPLCTF